MYKKGDVVSLMSDIGKIGVVHKVKYVKVTHQSAGGTFSSIPYLYVVFDDESEPQWLRPMQLINQFDRRSI